jgi:hypothetical protein
MHMGSVFLRSLTVSLFAAFATSLPAQIFSGMEVTESQLADFLKFVKKLETGQSNEDDVVQLLGPAHAKSEDAASQQWRYSFLVTADDEAAETANLERRIAALEKQDSALRDRLFKNLSDTEYRNVKAARQKIEDELQPLQERERERTFQHQHLQVHCDISFDNTGRISLVEVGKLTSQGREIVYSRGQSSVTNVDSAETQPSSEATSQPSSQASETPPESPSLGQIYFNTRDKAFYGWTGASWEKLSAGN